MEPDSIKAEEARREAMKPDLQKLREWANHMFAQMTPVLTDEAAKTKLTGTLFAVGYALSDLKKWCDEQEAGA